MEWHVEARMLRAAPENNDDDVKAFCARVVEEGVEAAAMQPDQAVHGVSLLLSLLPPSGSAAPSDILPHVDALLAALASSPSAQPRHVTAARRALCGAWEGDLVRARRSGEDGSCLAPLSRTSLRFLESLPSRLLSLEDCCDDPFVLPCSQADAEAALERRSREIENGSTDSQAAWLRAGIVVLSLGLRPREFAPSGGPFSSPACQNIALVAGRQLDAHLGGLLDAGGCGEASEEKRASPDEPGSRLSPQPTPPLLAGALALCSLAHAPPPLGRLALLRDACMGAGMQLTRGSAAQTALLESARLCTWVATLGEAWCGPGGEAEGAWEQENGGKAGGTTSASSPLGAWTSRDSEDGHFNSISSPTTLAAIPPALALLLEHLGQEHRLLLALRSDRSLAREAGAPPSLAWEWDASGRGLAHPRERASPALGLAQALAEQAAQGLARGLQNEATRPSAERALVAALGVEAGAERRGLCFLIAARVAALAEACGRFGAEHQRPRRSAFDADPSPDPPPDPSPSKQHPTLLLLPMMLTALADRDLISATRLAGSVAHASVAADAAPGGRALEATLAALLGLCLRAAAASAEAAQAPRERGSHRRALSLVRQTLARALCVLARPEVVVQVAGRYLSGGWTGRERGSALPFTCLPPLASPRPPAALALVRRRLAERAAEAGMREETAARRALEVLLPALATACVGAARCGQGEPERASHEVWLPQEVGGARAGRKEAEEASLRSLRILWMHLGRLGMVEEALAEDGGAPGPPDLAAVSPSPQLALSDAQQGREATEVSAPLTLSLSMATSLGILAAGTPPLLVGREHESREACLEPLQAELGEHVGALADGSVQGRVQRLLRLLPALEAGGGASAAPSQPLPLLEPVAQAHMLATLSCALCAARRAPAEALAAASPLQALLSHARLVAASGPAPELAWLLAGARACAGLLRRRLGVGAARGEGGGALDHGVAEAEPAFVAVAEARATSVVASPTTEASPTSLVTAPFPIASSYFPAPISPFAQHEHRAAVQTAVALVWGLAPGVDTAVRDVAATASRLLHLWLRAFPFLRLHPRVLHSLAGVVAVSSRRGGSGDGGHHAAAAHAGPLLRAPWSSAAERVPPSASSVPPLVSGAVAATASASDRATPTLAAAAWALARHSLGRAFDEESAAERRAGLSDAAQSWVGAWREDDALCAALLGVCAIGEEEEGAGGPATSSRGLRRLGGRPAWAPAGARPRDSSGRAAWALLERCAAWAPAHADAVAAMQTAWARVRGMQAALREARAPHGPEGGRTPGPAPFRAAAADTAAALACARALLRAARPPLRASLPALSEAALAAAAALAHARPSLRAQALLLRALAWAPAAALDPGLLALSASAWAWVLLARPGLALALLRENCRAFEAAARRLAGDGEAAGDGGEAAGDEGEAAGDGGEAAGDGGEAAGDGGEAAGEGNAKKEPWSDGAAPGGNRNASCKEENGDQPSPSRPSDHPSSRPSNHPSSRPSDHPSSHPSRDLGGLNLPQAGPAPARLPPAQALETLAAWASFHRELVHLHSRSPSALARSGARTLQECYTTLLRLSGPPDARPAALRWRCAFLRTLLAGVERWSGLEGAEFEEASRSPTPQLSSRRSRIYALVVRSALGMFQTAPVPPSASLAAVWAAASELSALHVELQHPDVAAAILGGQGGVEADSGGAPAGQTSADAASGLIAAQYRLLLRLMQDQAQRWKVWCRPLDPPATPAAETEAWTAASCCEAVRAAWAASPRLAVALAARWPESAALAEMVQGAVETEAARIGQDVTLDSLRQHPTPDSLRQHPADQSPVLALPAAAALLVAAASAAQTPSAAKASLLHPRTPRPPARRPSQAALRALARWRPLPLLEAMRALSSAGEPLVRAYLLRSLRACPAAKVAFFLPQLVQLLRVDADGQVEAFLVGEAGRDPHFCYALVCTLRTEGTPPEEALNPVVKRSGWRPPQDSGLWGAADRACERVLASLPAEARQKLDRQLEYVDAMTDVSGKLFPLAKAERKGAAQRFVAEVEERWGAGREEGKKEGEMKGKEEGEKESSPIDMPTTQSPVILPTNPHMRILRALPQSATPMPSAAKCPLLIAFEVETPRKSGASAEGAPAADGSHGRPGSSSRPPPRQACIFKVGDDCRQDVLALQVIDLLQREFRAAHLPLYLAPYGVLPTGYERGVIEVVPEAKSRAGVGELADGGLREVWLREFGPPGSERYERARENLIRSCAAYAVASYLLQSKDRHNGNILLDSQGHVVHIDFGFILGISPGGNLGFESAPFKLSYEMTQLLDPGSRRASKPWRRFCALCVRGFLAARHSAAHVVAAVAMMETSGLPCFSRGRSVQLLRQRFVPHLSDALAAQHMLRLIEQAYDKWTTGFYDYVQYLQNGIPK